MIVGIGIDIIEIERVRKVIGRHNNFADRFFSLEEAAYYRERGMNASSIAGGFAAKEAVVKAMGTGFGAFNWRDITILRNDLGKPEVRLQGRAKSLCEDIGIRRILVSVTHSRDYAAAQAIALGGDIGEGGNTETNERD